MIHTVECLYFEFPLTEYVSNSNKFIFTVKFPIRNSRNLNHSNLRTSIIQTNSEFPTARFSLQFDTMLFQDRIIFKNFILFSIVLIFEKC